MRKKARLVTGLAALAVALAACVSNAPQDSLKAKGPNAQAANDLFIPVFWIAVGIFVIVEGLLVLFVVRYRHRKDRERMPPQVHGNTRLEVAWTIVPALIFAGVAVPTVTTIFDLVREPPSGAVQVNVIGHQWWWEFEYPEQGVITANELHIPVGTPVTLTLCSAGLGYDGALGVPSDCQPGGPDRPPPANIGSAVIHSFWVPELAGAQDVIPGRVNLLILEADEPGVYEGTCKEFCGLSHANMRFTVVAHTDGDFQVWLEGQQRAAASPAEGSLEEQGMDLFLNGQFSGGTCIQCHAIEGTEAQVNGGPNLTHFASRDCFAGCIFENTPEELSRWLADPPARKPGSAMPDYGLSEDEIDALVAYLLSLE